MQQAFERVNDLSEHAAELVQAARWAKSPSEHMSVIMTIELAMAAKKLLSGNEDIHQHWKHLCGVLREFDHIRREIIAGRNSNWTRKSGA